jgi:hypothetical protein
LLLLLSLLVTVVVAVPRLLSLAAAGSRSTASLSSSPSAPLDRCESVQNTKLFVQNLEERWDGPTRSGPAVADALRTAIVQLYDVFLSRDGTAVDYSGMRNSPLFRRFARSTCELQMASLARLTDSELKAMMINLYNCLVIHGTAIYGPPRSTLKRAQFFSRVSGEMVTEAVTRR